MSPDVINGLFEMVGGLLLLLHSRRVWIDKEVKGVSLPPMLFFLGWGFWNLFYYPHLGQWWSFLGGILVVSANALWVSLVVWYSGTLGQIGCRLGFHREDPACTFKQWVYWPDDGVARTYRTFRECIRCRHPWSHGG